PRIVFHSGNVRVSALREDLGALQELLESHWSDYKYPKWISPVLGFPCGSSFFSRGKKPLRTS
ncbi:MAG: hypothetical protein WBW01_18210, partial [Terriglobales bacterium]